MLVRFLIWYSLLVAPTITEEMIEYVGTVVVHLRNESCGLCCDQIYRQM